MDDIGGVYEFKSPEERMLEKGSTIELTNKADLFALGLVMFRALHQEKQDEH